jgi:TM2 domain-containing membrane protein YozV
MLSNWSGWHTIAVVLGAVGSAAAWVAAQKGIDPTLLSIDHVVSQIDNLALMVVAAISGSALGTAAK